VITRPAAFDHPVFDLEVKATDLYSLAAGTLPGRDYTTPFIVV